MKKRKGFRILKGTVLFAILLIGAGSVAYSLLGMREDRTYTLKYGSIEISVPARAILIREETVVKTSGSGKISYMVAEGEKIKRQQVVALVETGVAPIEEETAETAADAAAVRTDLETLRYEIAFLETKIKTLVLADQFGEIPTLRETLEMKLEKLARTGGLSETEAVVSESSQQGEVNLVSPASGVLSYYIDGYEEILSMANLYAVDFDEVLSRNPEPVNRSSQWVDVNDTVYKLVDSTGWTLVALVSDAESGYFSPGQAVEAEIAGQRVSGQVLDVIVQSESRAVVIEMNALISDFQKVRIQDVTVHPLNFRGLIIENRSLVKRGGDYGVYVLNVNNQTSFVPVRIAGYDEENAIVLSDMYQEDGQWIGTVSLYDEIIRDASTVED